MTGRKANLTSLTMLNETRPLCLTRRTLLGAAVASAIAPISFATAATAQPRRAAASPGPATGTRTPTPTRLTLPTPTGPHPIGTVWLRLVDRARIDPWQDSRAARELMVQLWYPTRGTHGHPFAPWMLPAAVPFFEQAQGIPSGTLLLPTTHAQVAAPVDRGRCGRPVVLYSPGLRSGWVGVRRHHRPSPPRGPQAGLGVPCSARCLPSGRRRG